MERILEISASYLGSFVNTLIPAIIFIFLNDVLFLSRYYKYDTKENTRIIRRKLLRLVPVSPIGLFITLAVVLSITAWLLGKLMKALGAADFLSTVLVLNVTAEQGLTVDTAGGDTEALLILFVTCFIVAVPIVRLFIRRYCKIIGCSRDLGLFVYMAVMYMYVTSALITLPIGNPTVSSLVSMGSFIVMLLIFYLPSQDKIEFMRVRENTGMLGQINRLPIMNFILLLVLLALEFMLLKKGYLNNAFYCAILAFAVLLYAASQISYRILYMHIEERNRILELSRESQESQEQVTLAFAEITEAKSGQTGQHVKRVSEYTRVIAEAMGMDYKTVNLMRVASMMHDVGKLLIPPEILEKPGRLTDEEFEIMKNHVVIGESLLHNAPGEIMSMARVIAQQHHEWINGKGYLGMTGDEIELPAKICAVADVYDALTSARSYKKAWTAEEAYNIITEESGTHFDPEVVEAFKEHFEEIKEVQELYRDESSTYRF